jgi:hypothetical protein
MLNLNPAPMKTKILQSFIFFLFYVPLSAQVALDFRPFVAGLTDPVALVSAGDDRLFVVQQRGLIRILDLEGNVTETPFLDLSGVVSQSGSETGLLGLGSKKSLAQQFRQADRRFRDCRCGPKQPGRDQLSVSRKARW